MRILDNFHAQGPLGGCFPAYIAYAVDLLLGKAAALLGQTAPGASMARASSHTSSHDLAAHSQLTRLDEFRGGAHPHFPAKYHTVYFRVIWESTMFLASPASAEFNTQEQWANMSFKVSPSKTIPIQTPFFSEDSIPRALVIVYIIGKVFICATKTPTDQTFCIIS